MGRCAKVPLARRGAAVSNDAVRSAMMNTTQPSSGHLQNFWLCYWPLIACPIVTFSTWKGPPGIALLFALLVIREHRQWRGPWAPLIGFLVCFGCMIASGVSALLLMR